MSRKGRVSRASPSPTAARNCTREEGRSLGAGSQVQGSSHCKPLRPKAAVVGVAAKSGIPSPPVRAGEGGGSKTWMTCGKGSDDVETGGGPISRDKRGDILKVARAASGI